MLTCRPPIADVNAESAARSIAALRECFRTPPGKAPRTIEDVEADEGGFIRFRVLCRELERIAAEAGLGFEWISNAACVNDGDGDADEQLRLPKAWDAAFRWIEVSVAQGHCEGWMVRIRGVRRQDESSAVLASAKYLGNEYEAVWLACAIRRFLNT